MKKIIIILFVFLLCGCTDNVSYLEKLELLNTYPHNTSSFTQGLFFYNNELYESTGLYNESKLYKNIDLKTNNPSKEYSFDINIFAEGSTIFKDKLYVLTWKEKKVYVFDKDTLEVLDILKYDREGWGLTTDNNYLIASDGSNNIYFLDENLNTIKTISTQYSNINELEYIDGYIWANIYQTNDIIIINPSNGDVKTVINFDNLYNKETDLNSVLNGIAYNDNKIYITGKKWDTLYEFRIK